MKYYTLEEIIEALKKLIESGWGEVHIFIQDHKIPRYTEIKSHKPEEKEEK